MKHVSRLWVPLGTALLLLWGCKSSNQQQAANGPELPTGFTTWVAFYNVENLFDVDDDPGKDDSQFLPGGEYGWTAATYLAKLDNLSDAVMSMNNGQGPDILGLAEVENEQVLRDWVNMTDLKPRGYEYVLVEGPDPRGIDVAFLYDPDIFGYQRHETYEVDFPTEPDYITRPILRIDGSLGDEPVHIFVNHWPSRYGGQEESESRRVAAATTLREALDALLRDNPEANILLMGDFNDDPFNRSLSEVLGAAATTTNLPEDGLYNPWQALHNPDNRGTLTYRGKWNLFDQIILGEDLLDEEGSLYYLNNSAGIHNPEFMQVGGDSPAKDMPRRAIYRGEFQDRGFSDHFPVYLRLRTR